VNQTQFTITHCAKTIEELKGRVQKLATENNHLILLMLGLVLKNGETSANNVTSLSFSFKEIQQQIDSHSKKTSEENCRFTLTADPTQSSSEPPPPISSEPFTPDQLKLITTAHEKVASGDPNGLQSMKHFIETEYSQQLEELLGRIEKLEEGKKHLSSILSGLILKYGQPVRNETSDSPTSEDIQLQKKGTISVNPKEFENYRLIITIDPSNSEGLSGSLVYRPEQGQDTGIDEFI